MACPTHEQLASFSLGEVVDTQVIEHAKNCEICARVLATQGDVVDQMSAAHSAVGAQHAASRVRLLSNLPPVAARRLPRPWQRWAYGSLGLTAAAVLVLLSLVAVSPSRLSAMERIVSAVRGVRSFSYRLMDDSHYPANKDKPARTLEGNTFTFWRAPAVTEPDQFGDLRGSQSNKWVYHLPTGDEQPKVTIDVVEIHPSGRPGILIDYVAKKLYRVPALHAADIAGSTPLLWLRAVREKAGRITDDLGTQLVAGRTARGYVMTFDGVAPFADFGPVEVWVDPQTDLPVEFSFGFAKPEPGVTNRYTVTDIQWNAEIDPKLFDTTAPAGFLDVTIPTDEKSIAEIVAALELYAELSGGRYPHVEKLDERIFATKFDADVCYHEMIDLAGLADSDRKKLAANPLYQRIETSRAGLDTLERILQSYKWLIGYYGDSVGAQDREKLLLWWNIALDSSGDQYRVFYGDLRTEVISGKEWARKVLPEIAELAE